MVERYLLDLEPKTQYHLYSSSMQTAAETLLLSKFHEGGKDADLPSQASSPCDSPRHLPEFAFGTASHVTQLGSSSRSLTPHVKEKAPRRRNNLAELYSELYSYFGDSLSIRLGFEVDIVQALTRLDRHVEQTAGLIDLVNEKVTFDGTMFRQRQPGVAAAAQPAKARTNPEPVKAKPQPRVGTPGHRSQSLRTRHGRGRGRFRSRSGSLRDAFQIFKPVKPLGKKTATVQLESKVWQVNLRMGHVGKRRKRLRRVGLPPNKNLPSIQVSL